jgi:MoxR-like ATPase
MEERQVSADGQTYGLEEPFVVMATQNPIEYEGTFALPEAQLDRFMLRIQLGYPLPNEEVRILDEHKTTRPIDEIGEVVTGTELQEMQEAVREIYVDPQVSEYIVRLVTATRNHPDIYLGASPRGSLGLYRAGQAYAALFGRDYVIPDDIKALAIPALAHRTIVKTAATVRDVDSTLIIRELLDSVPVETHGARSERPAAARRA